MIDLPILWQFMALLATHYVADFVCQTHWQASNKSRNNLALLEHVGVYSVVLALGSGVVLGFGAMWFGFVWMNAVAHLCVDWVTSRWSAHHFRRAIHDDQQLAELTKTFLRIYQRPPTAADQWDRDIRPGQQWHRLFEVIGLDQLIHQATLATTLWFVVA